MVPRPRDSDERPPAALGKSVGRSALVAGPAVAVHPAAAASWTSSSGTKGGSNSGRWSTNRRTARTEGPAVSGQADRSCRLPDRQRLLQLADGWPGLEAGDRGERSGCRGIGIQAHESPRMRFPLDRVREILDRYASLRKELHITEFTPTSSGDLRAHCEALGTRRPRHYVSSTGFASPIPMRAINRDSRPAPTLGGGMLRETCRPNPSMSNSRLIHEEWKLGSTTDANGRLFPRVLWRVPRSSWRMVKGAAVPCRGSAKRNRVDLG